MFINTWKPYDRYIDRLVQKTRNSSALAIWSYIFLALAHQYMSINWPTVGSDDDILPVRHGAITWTKANMLLIVPFGSLQNKIWNLPDRSTILPKFIYDKEGKRAIPTQILLVRVRGLALILKTALGTNFYEMWIKTRWIAFKKMHLKMLPAKYIHFVSVSML